MSLTKSRPKRTPTQHKKRAGAHHRKSKQYMKTYWPYLPMLLIVGLGLLVNTLWSSNGHVLGAMSNFSATTFLADTNAQRLADHENALTLNPKLMAAAQAKAEDMVKEDFWSHNTPQGKTPWTFITAAGYTYQAAGENLAYGFANAGDAVTGWMNSPEHRANILDASYQNVGFGIASSPNYLGQGPQTVIVAEYAEPEGISIGARVPATPENTPKPQTNAPINSSPVSRIQDLTGVAWTSAAVLFFTLSAAVLFVLRHGNRFRKLVIEGETFVMHHAFLDIAFVLVATIGILLTRTSGFIG